MGLSVFIQISKKIRNKIIREKVGADKLGVLLCKVFCVYFCDKLENDSGN